MWKRIAVVCLGLGLAGTMACVDGEGGDSPDDIARTGMNLTMDVQGNSDVAGFRYIVNKCGKTKNPEVDTVQLFEDMTLPGGIVPFVDAPFDGDSSHLFSDYFMSLMPGCYDVKVQPITKKNKNSKDCQPVEATGIHVKEGKTREILLVSQCRGEESVGALDVVAGLNFPPQITDIDYSTEKFITCEQDEIVICAEAYDPDRDPMVFDWDKIDGSKLEYGPKVVYSVQNQGIKKECVKIKFKNKTENYKFRVTVYDQFHGKHGLMTAEKWFKQNGYGNVDSHATMEVPVYVQCDPPAPVADTCPETAMWWKKNPSYWPGGKKHKKLFKYITWMGVMLAKHYGNDVCYPLGQEYVAARLNQIFGAKTPDHIADAINSAGDLLENHCPGLNSGVYGNKQRCDEADELREILKKYNNGKYKSPYCEEITNGDNNLPI